MRIALIADELTRSSLGAECDVVNLTPLNYRVVLTLWKPDFILVESAWEGLHGRWKFKIAAYPSHPERSNSILKTLVDVAKQKKIPCIFWNKEDSVHFDRFIDSAKLFNRVLTVDENAIAKYKSVLPSDAKVDVMMFAVQERFHYPDGLGGVKRRRANFVGSYGTHVHPLRRERQNLLFSAFSQLGITVYDRNSHRKAAVYRYPVSDSISIERSVKYSATADIYRQYAISLNVNTVEDSRTMFSRRLVEIIACGAVAVTTPSLSVDTLFGQYCTVVRDLPLANEIAEKVAKDGLSPEMIERAVEGARFISNNHTWRHRIEQMRAFAL